MCNLACLDVYILCSQEDMKLNWYISTTMLNESCNSSYSTYNPFNVSMTGNYTSDCTVESQLRCAMGDLTGKLGQLTVESGTGAKVKTYTFYDDLLYLTGPNSGEVSFCTHTKNC